MALFQLENMSFTYPGENRRVLTDLNFSIQEGEFFVLCGASGSGKSTLLRLLKHTIAPAGKLEGHILYRDTPVHLLQEKTLAGEIGFVFQNPDSQLVSDHVYNELAFGLENLGVSPVEIDSRVAETAAFFGMEAYFDRRTTQLSGGEKQLLNLASVMVMEPSVLLLDEPLSQLDPIAKMDFIEQLRRVNQELGITVIMAEHDLDEVYGLCDRMLVLEGGKPLYLGQKRDAAETLFEKGHPMARAMPASIQVMKKLEIENAYPADTKEARNVLLKKGQSIKEANYLYKRSQADTILRCKNISFAYTRGTQVLEDINLSLQEGGSLGIIGGNGAGKSTLLAILSGNLRPQRGKVICKKKIGYLPQNPYYMFLKDTLEEDLAFLCKTQGLPPDAYLEKMEMNPFFQDLGQKLAQNPMDLSGGEAQKAALFKLVLAGNEILLLDEPAKGLDAPAKEALIGLIAELRANGAAVIFVSHDLDFTAQCAEACVMLFHGKIAAHGTPRELFSANSYYTTPVRKITKGFAQSAVALGDLEGLE